MNYTALAIAFVGSFSAILAYDAATSTDQQIAEVAEVPPPVAVVKVLTEVDPIAEARKLVIIEGQRAVAATEREAAIVNWGRASSVAAAGIDRELPRRTTTTGRVSQSVRPRGVPEHVYRGIKKLAAENHPSSHSMQTYTIDKQISAYLKLKNFKHRKISGNIMLKMLRNEERDHPGDYSMQLYQIENQSTAFVKLKALHPGNVPSSAFLQMVRDAKADHPEDYATQLHVVERDLKSYRRKNR